MLIEKLKLAMLELDTLERADHEKKSFWCSEAEKPLFDLYHAWIGTPPTNPIDAEKLIVFSAGKMMELALVEQLNKAGLAIKNDEQIRVEMERNQVPITGYVDAILTDGSPLELKSFYGEYQARELELGKPKTSYLKQLAIYMDFLNKDTGYLVYMDRGTGAMYEFKLTRKGTVYTCNDIEFNLWDTYERWAKLYNQHIAPKIEPNSEFRYKIPVDDIDWSKVSKTDISKARNNQKVIGDSWQVAYSPYKDLIIQKEGTCVGYTEEEIEKIKAATAGYSSRK